MSNKTPRWNLDSLYTDINSAEYKKDLADYTQCMNALDKLIADAEAQTKTQDSFNKWLDAYLTQYNNLAMLAGTIIGYAYIIYSTDTTNTDYLNNLDAIEQMNIRANQQQLIFSGLLAEHKDKLDAFYEYRPQYKEFKFIFDETIEETNHRMSAAEEKLAADLNQTGGSAWGMLQEQIISNLQDENGKTFNEIRNEAYDANPEVRKSAWEKEIKLLSQNRNENFLVIEEDYYYF